MINNVITKRIQAQIFTSKNTQRDRFMSLNNLNAISPIDGRYANKTAPLKHITSEMGLMRYRTQVEIEWLIALSNHPSTATPQLSDTEKTQLRLLYQQFDEQAAQQVKMLESSCQHDVKAIEYYIAQACENLELPTLIPWIHFACTSEDINNVAYALMLRDANEQCLPYLKQVLNALSQLACDGAHVAMLCRTHGQSATPSTIGKEITNVIVRLERQYNLLLAQVYRAKFNGATGNYNAHLVAYPTINWPKFNQAFIQSLGLEFNTHTTQIEPHDDMAEYMHTLCRANTILIDWCRDAWGYISLGYFKQQNKANEVGSSTMPHKINPIDFENAEGNLGVCNALANHMANKLPISRWQRDLSDSTVLRNLGSIMAYALLAYQSIFRGLSKLCINHEKIKQELDQHWELLAEPIQTVMRREGISNAYEQLKQLSRGKVIEKADITAFIEQLNLPDAAKAQLHQLTPGQYIGYANQLSIDGKKD